MDFLDLKTVTVTLADHVLTVTLQRPDRMNAFNDTMCSEFRELWRYAAELDDVHVIVLRAAGDRAFSTGADVKEGLYRSPNPFTRRDPGEDLSPKRNGCWKPMVCAVHGLVAGGALYWVNEADLIIASGDTEFFDPHVSYGSVAALEPIGLAHRMPLGEGLRMALLGLDERIGAKRAHQLGLVSEIVDREALWDRAQYLAERIAAKPSIAVQGTVRAIWESRDVGRSQALATGMSYTVIGNEIGRSQVNRSEVSTREYDVR